MNASVACQFLIAGTQMLHIEGKLTSLECYLTSCKHISYNGL